MTTETLDKAVPQHVLPKFPTLTGALGRLVDAITDDIPYEHRALTVLTYVGLAISGRTKLAGEDYETLQPRFYACLIGPPSSGKSAATNEVKTALKDRLADERVVGSIDSGPALVELLAKHPRLIYMPDEGSAAFAKFKSGQALGGVLSLLEHNEVENVVKEKETIVHNAHFAMVMSATPEGFVEMWNRTRGASSGLQSRFVLSFSDQKKSDIPTGSKKSAVEAAVAALRDVLKNLPPTVDLPEQKGDFTNGLKKGLNREGVAAVRALDMGRRFAFVLAVCNGKTKIEAHGEEIRLGREFIRYQLAMFDRFMPEDASNNVDRFVSRILKYFKTHPGSHTERELRIQLTPHRSPGGLEAFKKAFALLTANLAGDTDKYTPKIGYSGELLRDGRAGSYGYGPTLWKLNPDRDPHPTTPTGEDRAPQPTTPTDGIPLDEEQF